jgi:hypothetical protein
MKMDSADRVYSQTKRQDLKTLDCKLLGAQSPHMFCQQAASGRILSSGPKVDGVTRIVCWTALFS